MSVPRRLCPKSATPLVAGRHDFWSWAVIDEVDREIVYFRQLSAQHAASIATLVGGTPSSV